MHGEKKERIFRVTLLYPLVSLSLSLFFNSLIRRLNFRGNVRKEIINRNEIISFEIKFANKYFENFVRIIFNIVPQLCIELSPNFSISSIQN